MKLLVLVSRMFVSWSPIEHRLLINYIKLLTHLHIKLNYLNLIYAQLRPISIGYGYSKYISILIYFIFTYI